MDLRPSRMEQVGACDTAPTGSSNEISSRTLGIDTPSDIWTPSPVTFAQADADLERRVRSFLATRSEPALRRLDVRAQSGRVTIRGQVRSFYERQLAIHCCRRVAGVNTVVDEVAVQVSVPRSQSS